MRTCSIVTPRTDQPTLLSAYRFAQEAEHRATVMAVSRIEQQIAAFT
jgi:hypothetical protein